jgi:hypothetical protein
VVNDGMSSHLGPRMLAAVIGRTVSLTATRGEDDRESALRIRQLTEPTRSCCQAHRAHALSPLRLALTLRRLPATSPSGIARNAWLSNISSIPSCQTSNPPERADDFENYRLSVEMEKVNAGAFSRLY